MSATFRRPSGDLVEPFANVADVAHIDGLVIRLEAAGDRRTWSGSIYIDDVSWR